MKLNNEGILDLSEAAKDHLKEVNTILSLKLLSLNDTIVKGYLDLFRNSDIEEDFSIYDVKGRDAECLLPLYLQIDDKVVLVSMDHMSACTYSI